MIKIIIWIALAVAIALSWVIGYLTTLCEVVEMTKHDRLMNALAEIKEVCSKNEDYEFGCGKKCPFLMGKDGDNFRGCEIMTFTRQDSNELIDTPMEWGQSE